METKKVKKLISFVLPAYNEEKNIPQMFDDIKAVISSLENKYRYEIIFINDGSSDNSWAEIIATTQKDNGVKAINLSRNFGHQSALEAGIENAMGDAVIMLDCDGQHPVEIIEKLIEKWESGFKIVNTIRKDTEGVSRFKKITAKFFYSLINRFSDTKIIPGSADFRLIDRIVADTIKKLPEQNKFYRGLINWVGFPTGYVEYNAKDRRFGKTSYTLKRMYKFAVDGLTGFSNFPLTIAKYIGLMIMAVGTLTLLSMLLLTLIGSSHFPIWVYLIVLVFLLNGLQFIVLWFIGNYIGRIFNQQRQRPNYIISEKINF
ncbi:MAG: hypothetical protein BWY19_00450 [bacterium ADurb.Bin212]|nr:MAG: hypothetical protein BWY19_00450 [bacterium ADurb.Bin212]